MRRKTTSAFLAGLLCLSLASCGGEAPAANPFPSWSEDAPALKVLETYVERVTEAGSEDFIPAEDRIAVFDLDGTLYCETAPIYGEWLLFADYVLNTPDYDPPAHIRAVAEELAAIERAADIPAHMEQTHIKAHAEAFAGMRVEDYLALVDRFRGEEAEGFSGMTRGEAFYRPMLEVVDYLIGHEFLVYICSGTGRFTVRGLIDGVIDIPPRQVIGSDFTLVAEGQDGKIDMHYNYTEEDGLLFGGELITKNVKMSKAAQLEQELGQRPVLVFGNGTGDISMAVYARQDNPYPTEVFFLLCDDTEREYGSPAKAEQTEAFCRERGWNTISMAEDWTTVYGEGVSRSAQEK